jgi:hypothetical protein
MERFGAVRHEGPPPRLGLMATAPCSPRCGVLGHPNNTPKLATYFLTTYSWSAQLACGDGMGSLPRGTLRRWSCRSKRATIAAMMALPMFLPRHIAHTPQMWSEQRLSARSPAALLDGAKAEQANAPRGPRRGIYPTQQLSCTKPDARGVGGDVMSGSFRGMAIGSAMTRARSGPVATQPRLRKCWAIVCR